MPCAWHGAAFDIRTGDAVQLPAVEPVRTFEVRVEDGRVWVRTGSHEDGRTMVEYGLLARGEDHRLAGEAAAIRALLQREWGLDADGPGTPSSISSPAGSAEPKKDR